MKPQIRFSKFTLLLSTSIVAMLGAFVAAPLPASAQEDAVTISAAEFQRTVYAADLLARFAEKPELERLPKIFSEKFEKSWYFLPGRG